ncbi:putative fungal pheromone GPCR, STE3-type [Mycena polygramma]|nr:putative fungal pheromone GPCR, STE3-type [Mycena polygramma]
MPNPTDPTYPAFPLFSFLGFVLVLVPLPWHFQAWNSGTCLFMIWTSISCLIGFVNSLVWANTIDDLAPVWCDISTRLIVGIAVAIPAASLCINRRLYKIASCSTVSITKAEKRRAVLVDLAIGLGIPLVQMPLQFIVQGHRYDILENVGCYPTTYNVVPAYPLSYLWPNIINLISAVYVLFTLRAFLHRRAQFASLLSSTLPALTPNRYFRLMALASLELVLNLPLATYGLYLTASRSRIAPWVSWADTHADFFAINQVPALFWRADGHTQATVELSRWAGVICALAFFAFFGFAAEARKHYRMAFWAVGKRMGFTPPKDNAFPSIRLPWGKDKPKAAMPFSLAASSSTGGKSLPRTPVKRRPDSLSPSLADSRTDYDFDDITDAETDAHSMEKRDYILPSPSSSSSARGFAPPYVRDVEAYPMESPSSQGSMLPESPRTPRPMTWPSLHSPRPPPPAFPPAHAPAS